MKIVIDKYPTNCSTCIFKSDNFSSRKNYCSILHVDIGGINDVRFNNRCYDKFILFNDMMDQYNIEKETKVMNKTDDEIIENESLNLKDKIELNDSENINAKKFKDIVDDFVKLGKDNIDKYGEGRIIVDSISLRDEEEIKRQREEVLDRASKRGFLDTGEVVSIGDEIRKVKDIVREMDKNSHHKKNTNIEENKNKTLTKEQTDEMMCENFGGLI